MEVLAGIAPADFARISNIVLESDYLEVLGLTEEKVCDHLRARGYAAEAREVTTSEHGGYVFKAFAEASGTMALARLRGKVRQGLAQRFLIKDGATIEMPFERIRGRIDSEGVVVDGRLVTWDEFLELLHPYEGWEFDLRIPLDPDW